MSSSIPISKDSGAETTRNQRGRLHVYLGYAAGVGKTYKMMEEGQGAERARRGRRHWLFRTARAQGHDRQDRGPGNDSTAADRSIAGRFSRRWTQTPSWPGIQQVCLVDEFPHTNVKGSERAKRWEDVQILLDAGIDVLTTMNIQRLESLNDQIWHITGIQVRETSTRLVRQERRRGHHG